MLNFPRGRKRTHEVELFEDVGQQMPFKRRAPSQEPIDIEDHRHDTPSRKEMPSSEVIDIEDNQEQLLAEQQPLIPVTIDLTIGKEIYDSHPETRGSGSKYDPCTLVEWSGDGVIAAVDQGAHINLISDDEDEHDSVRLPVPMSRSPSSFFSYLSPSLRRTPIPDPEAQSHDNLRGPSRSQSRTLSPAPVPGIDEEENSSDLEDSPSQDEIIMLDDGDNLDGDDYKFTQDWTTFKQEPEDDVQDLFSFPDSNATFGLPTPASSQDSHKTVIGSGSDSWTSIVDEILAPTPKDSQIAQKKARRKPTEEEKLANKLILMKKKTIFWYTYGPKNLGLLRAKIASWRQDHPETKSKEECWLYSGFTRKGQGALKVHLGFSDEEFPPKKYKYTVNVAYISMLVDGFMTDDFKAGIINHSWHASHLCGNWNCTNPRHVIAESGSVNTTRNSCLHGRVEVCVHSPPCMKGLRVERQPEPLEQALMEKRKLEEFSGGVGI